MMAIKNVSIREASSRDQEFLWEMLYQSLHVPDGQDPYSRDIVTRPELAKYVRNWGREGDIGFVAIDLSNNEPVGASWLRLFGSDDKGYGYVNDETPELGIAVRRKYRGLGIGTALLTSSLEAAGALYTSVSLSVSTDNPALRLYQRFGFQKVAISGGSITMVKRLVA
jgi:ribosomal protein S18 acetylase RimI-like enzyme